MQLPYLATDLLVHALLRTTVSLGLNWQSAHDPLTVSRVDGVECVENRFRIDKGGAWLQFIGLARTGLDGVPQGLVRLCVPVRELSRAQLRQKVQAAYLQHRVPAYLDSAGEMIVLERTMRLEAFHATPAHLVDPEFVLEELEAVTAVVNSAFSAACLFLSCPPSSPSEELTGTHTGESLSDDTTHFAVAVLARMYREGWIRFRPGAPALRFLVCAIARKLFPGSDAALRAIGGPQGSSPDSASSAWVTAWLSRRLSPQCVGDLYLEALLLATERHEERPGEVSALARPTRQRRLLWLALGRAPERWKGIEVARQGWHAALAAGLESLEADVPASFVRRVTGPCSAGISTHGGDGMGPGAAGSS